MAINQLKAGAVLSYVVLGLSNLVALLYTPYMLRMLGQSEYGLYSLVASVIAYLTIFDFGFGNAIVRYTAKFRAEGKKDEQYSMFGMFLIFYSIIGLLTFIIGLSIYFNIESIFDSGMSASEISKAKIMFLIMLFNLAFTFPMSIFGAIINAYEQFIFQKIVSIARILLNTIVMIIVLEIGYKAIGLVVITTIFNFVSLLINYFYCINYIKIKIVFRKFDWTFLREVGIYSFFIFLNIIMDRVYWSTGQFILGAVSGTVAVAVFSVAISIQNMYMSFSTAISGVFLPHVTSITTKTGTEKEISELFIKTGRLQYIVMAFILTGFIVFGKKFIVLWAGIEYVESYYIALVFLIPSTISLIQNLGIIILQARNQMKFRSILYIIISILSLIIQIPLARHYGAIGVAIGVSIGIILGQIISMNIYYQKKQHIDIKQFWIEISKMSVPSVILGTIAFFVMSMQVDTSIIGLMLEITIFSIIYIPTVWFFSINSSEKQMITSLVNNKKKLDNHD